MDEACGHLRLAPRRFPLAHDPTVLRSIFRLVRGLTCPVGVVFGNHDVWLSDRLRHEGKTSWDILGRACSLAEEAGLGPLDRRPLQVGDVWIVGSIGWYDPSLGSAVWSTEQYARQRLGDGVWQDSAYATWTMSDPDDCSEFVRLLDTNRLPKERSVGKPPVYVTSIDFSTLTTCYSRRSISALPLLSLAIDQ